jgi:hypothetical protein
VEKLRPDKSDLKKWHCRGTMARLTERAELHLGSARKKSTIIVFEETFPLENILLAGIFRNFV